MKKRNIDISRILVKIMGTTLATFLFFSMNVHAEEVEELDNSEDIATISDGIDTLDEKVDTLNDNCQDEELSEDISDISYVIDVLNETISKLSRNYAKLSSTIDNNRRSIIDGLNRTVFSNNNISKSASYSDVISKINGIKNHGTLDVTLDGNDKFTLESGYYEGGTIDVSAIVEAVREEAYNAGKADGYKEGKEEGLKEGITEGIKSGRDEGVKAGKEEGFNAGKEEGIKEGFESGKEEGFNAGKEEGIKEGFESGKEEGFNAGKEEGLKEGKEEGFNAGKEEGLKEGKEEGFNAGKEEGIKEGKDIAIIENKQTWIDEGKNQAIRDNKQTWIDEGKNQAIRDNKQAWINEGKQQRYSKTQSISTRFGVYQDTTGYGYIKFDELSNINGFSSISVTTDGRLNLSTFSVSGNVLTLGGYYDGWGTGYVNVSATAFQY
ncbi:hypothetical protein SAMN02910451_00794 [Butyrivibrio hungatei]|uniref:Uncharacterized protein n=1 Tax=Butyrivibrio hungatei TaxID=185008 RepID=A0A1G5BSK0_9FIRM|nr:hypothetical protein [Butyrivibrio hungatei]SCX93189.1 hypothetical protein SAMN02910451_00794 [Butyrivibrio hungatei]